MAFERNAIVAIPKLQYHLALGYVCEMKKLLVTMSKAEMKEVYQRQKQKEPDPLTAQFSDRLSREDAIKRQIERQKKTVNLVPSGTF